MDHPHGNSYRPGSVGKEVVEVMVDIKRDSKYYLRSNSECCWIEEEYEYTNPKTGKPIKVVRNISGFYPNFRMLAQTGLPSHLVRSTEGKSLKRALESLKREEEKIARMTAKRIEEIRGL